MTKLKIELGKRYVRCDGKVTDIVEHEAYMSGKDYVYTSDGYIDVADLIEKYVEPVPIEVWAAVDIDDNTLLETSASLDLLKSEFTNCRFVKLREVTDEV